MTYFSSTEWWHHVWVCWGELISAQGVFTVHDWQEFIIEPLVGDADNTVKALFHQINVYICINNVIYIIYAAF